MKKVLLYYIGALSLLIAVNVNAQDEAKVKKLKLSADVRFRIEMDRNSKKSDGSMRVDRDRLRYRARFGVRYNLTKNYEFGMRIRSGNPKNQQSPHTTLGNGFDSHQFSIDKAYVKIQSDKGIWAWAGKNSMPFWKQNELLWDSDVNPEGISAGSSFNIGTHAKLTPVVGYYIIANSKNITANGEVSQKFGDHSNMALAQCRYTTNFTNNKLTVTSGLLAAHMQEALDYNIWATSVQYKLNSSNIVLGVDYFTNLADLKGKTNFEGNRIDSNFEDQKEGYVFNIKYDKNKFGARITYASIEKYAVIDMFAQDDWLRWGNSDMTRSSNFKGFELNFKYKITHKFNTILRFWNIKGIEKTGTDLETGTRVRLDFNFKF